MPSVPRSLFTVDHLSPPSRFGSWHESISCIFDVARCRSARQDEAFRARLEARMLGGMMLVRTATQAQRWRRSAPNIARDGMDHYMLQLYQHGTQSCTWRRGELEMPADGILVYDLSQEMEARASDLENLSLIIPRALLAPLLRAPDDMHMLALDPGSPLLGLLKNHLCGLEHELDRIHPRQAAQLVQATVHLAAACLNAAHRPSSALDTALAMPSQLLALKREIDRRLTRPDLSPASLCQHFGLSRSRLYEIFAPVGGVAEFIRERRLAVASSLLADPACASLPIGEVAARFHFEPSEFSRAFRKRYGMSPRTMRHYGLKVDASGEASTVDRRYERWLHDLTA